MSRLATIFKLNRSGIDIERAFLVLVLALVELLVFAKEQYILSAFFGMLFIGLSDLGGEFGSRLGRMLMKALIGALLTLIGFMLGPGSWY